MNLSLSLGQGAITSLLLACTMAQAQAQFPVGPPLPVTQFDLRAQSAFVGQEGIAQSGAFSAIGSISASLGPMVSVHGVGPQSNVTADNEASAQALWAFEIVGPAGVAVPLLINGMYDASFDNAFGVSGGVALGVDRFRLDSVLSFRCLSSDASGCGTHSFTLHEDALSGAETFIHIGVGGTLLGAQPGRPGSFSAMIDPLIMIDPSFARASEFTLFVSPGANGGAPDVPVMPAVPEPETYALLLAGLLALGPIVRRRRAA